MTSEEFIQIYQRYISYYTGHINDVTFHLGFEDDDKLWLNYTFAAEATHAGGTPERITISPLYLLNQFPFTKAIIAHEIGHCIDSRFNTSDLYTREYTADLLAIKICNVEKYELIQGLLYTCGDDIPDMYQDSESHPSLKKRIQFIRNI